MLLIGGILRSAGYAVETFAEAKALLQRLTASDRGCAVLDLQMPELNGLELQKAMFAQRIRLPIVFVSGRADVPKAVAAMKQGAVDFLSKPVEPSELLAVIERALLRDVEATAERDARGAAQALWTALSTREQEVCRGVAKGWLNKQISANLGTAESTVKVQRAAALKKLGVDSVADLVRLMTHVCDVD